MSQQLQCKLQPPSPPATVSRRTTDLPALTGVCATFEGLDTRALLAELGPGEALPAPLRESMRAELGADLEGVRLHTNGDADRLAAYLGAEAFALHQHIAFRHNRYQPHSPLGRALLVHELTHTLEPHGPVRAWLTVECNECCVYKYSVGEFKGEVTAHDGDHTTHRWLTMMALGKVCGFGEHAWKHILMWNELVDADKYKKGQKELSNLIAAGFPELGKLRIGGRDVHLHIGHVHSYPLPGDPDRPGVGATEMGFSSNEVTANLKFEDEGVIIKLLDAAVRNADAKAESLDHAFHLLGISLHMIQDYFSHNVALRVAERRGQNLRVALAKDPNYGNKESGFWILEDDPKRDPTRFRNAQARSEDQLRKFRRQLKKDHPPHVWKLRG